MVKVREYLPKSEAVVQWCSIKKLFWWDCQNSQKNTYSEVSFLVQLLLHSLKKDFCNGIFLSVCQIFQSTFFAKHFWVTATTKHPFVRYIDLYHKILPSVLVIIWLSLNIFKANSVNRLRTSVCRSPTHLSRLPPIKQALHSKCCGNKKQLHSKNCSAMLHQFD